jgi:hypothetical protein
MADYIHARNPTAAQHVRAAIYESLQNFILDRRTILRVPA